MPLQRKDINIYATTTDRINHAVLIGNAFHDFYVTRLLPVVTVFLGFFKQNYFHRSSIATGWKFPSLMSFSPSLTIFSNSVIDIRFSSFACFCEAIRFKDLTAFFIRPSSPDIVWRAAKSSELSCICMEVISSCVYLFCLQIYTYFLKQQA